MIKKGKKGITLVELLVVIGIFVVVSSILIFNYSDFRSNVSVRNLAHEIGLIIRKAQNYATGVRGVDVVSTRDFPAFGISFSYGNAYVSDLNPDEKEFILFTDLKPSAGSPSNNIYDHSLATCGVISLGEECLEKFSINTGDRINFIYVYDANGNKSLLTSNTVINIIFNRPSPDAKFCVSGSCNYSGVQIELVSYKGIKRTINVWNTGQISVQ